MELENMLTLIKAVSDSELTHFSLETEEMKLTLEKKREQAWQEAGRKNTPWFTGIQSGVSFTT